MNFDNLINPIIIILYNYNYFATQIRLIVLWHATAFTYIKLLLRKGYTFICAHENTFNLTKYTSLYVMSGVHDNGKKVDSCG